MTTQTPVRPAASFGTIDQLRGMLEPLGFELMHLDSTSDIVFSKPTMFENQPTVIRIYTAINRRDGRLRPAGSNAIRVLLGRWTYDELAGCGAGDWYVRIFKALPTVHRRPDWQRQLSARLADIESGAVPPKPQWTTGRQLANQQPANQQLANR